jgi:uncharacterized protein YdhG (YjbR/CyaY superfamily)
MGFSDAEKEAMKQRARELAAEAKASKNRALGEKDLLAAIAKMAEPDRSMAARIHELISKNAPGLWPKTWYGMPAYARDEKVVCFFQNAGKFKARYSTLGFNDPAKLDDGNMWSTAFALIKLTAAEEAKIIALVKKAA